MPTAITVSDFLQNPQAASIADTAANVLYNLAALVQPSNVAFIGTINLTDENPPTLTVTKTQFLNSTALLDKISGSFSLNITGAIAVGDLVDWLLNHQTLASNLKSLSFSDSLEHVLGNLDELQNNVAKIGSISLTGSGTPANITAAQFVTATGTVGVLKKIVGTYTVPVGDTAANIADNIAALQSGLSKIASLSVSDGQPLTITLAQMKADAAVLNKLGSYALDVSGAKVANLATLFADSHVHSVGVVDTAANILLPANQIVLANPKVSKLAIVDTAANLSAKFNDLQTYVLAHAGTSITVSNPAQVIGLTKDQLDQDTAALSALQDDYKLALKTAVAASDGVTILSNSHIASLTIKDTLANVLGNLDDLQSNASKIASVTLILSSAALPNIDATQFAAATSIGGVLKKIAVSYSVPVSDTAANIAVNIAALQKSLTKIASLEQTDAEPLAISLAQMTADAGVLSKLGSYTLDVSGVKVANLTALSANNHVHSISVADTAANILANQSKLTDGKITAVGIVDTAANISAKLDDLQTHGSVYASITISNPTQPIGLSESQLNSDVVAINAIQGNYKLALKTPVAASDGVTILTDYATHIASLPIKDTLTNVLSNLDGLQSNAAKIGAITLLTSSDAPPEITAAQFAAATGTGGVLKKITVAYSLAVSDTVANIAANISALQKSLTKIASLTQIDSDPLAISLAQMTANAGVLKKLGDAYTLDVSGVSLSKLASVIANTHVVSYSLADTAANIVKQLDALQGYLNTGTPQLAGIVFTDTKLPYLTITAGQFLDDGGALGLITSPYGLNVTGVTADNLADVLSNNHTVTIALSDTAANIANLLDGLQLLTVDKMVNGIVLTDLSQNSLPLTLGQYLNDGAALGKIAGAYTLAISEVPAAGINTILADPHVKTLAVADTLDSVIANAASLQTKLAKISDIVLTDASIPSHLFSATEWTAIAGVMAKISSDCELTVTGVAAANVLSVLSNTHVLSLTVADTAANISTNLSDLHDHLDQISDITLTGTLTLTADQLLADGDVLGKISSDFTLTVTGGIPVSALITVLAYSHLSLSQPLQIADTAENISANLDMLHAQISHIANIALTDGSAQALVVSIAQLGADADVLAKINNPASYLLNIADSADNVRANLSTLEDKAGQIDSITLTDLATPTLALPTSDYTANIDALATIASPYTLQLTDDTGGMVPTQIPAFTVRAPNGASGTVTLTVSLALNGGDSLVIGTIQTEGRMPVQFSPGIKETKPGDSWHITVTATDAGNHDLGAGQVEMTPGFMGSTVSGGYAAAADVQFIGISPTGSINGLPGHYSGNDNNYYILQGSEAGNLAVSLAGIQAADTNGSVLQQYIQAGRVAIGLLDGAVQPEAQNAAAPSILVNGDSIPVMDDNFDAQQGAILVNAAAGTSVQMWLSDGVHDPVLVNTQTLTVAAPYAGFSAPSGLAAGTYSLYFTDASGNGVPGADIASLQAAVSAPQGGNPGTWSAAPTHSAPITLVVGTVSDIVSDIQAPSGNVWYVVKDTLENIQASASNLDSLIKGNVSGQKLLGAYLTDGFAPMINAQPDAIAILQPDASRDYVRVLSNDNSLGQSPYSLLALHTVDGLGNPLPASTYSVQLNYNGSALGAPFSIATDGSSTSKAVLLPTSVSASGSLTATLDGNSIEIGAVPAGGGLPRYAASLNVWVGSVAQLPASLSAIADNTLYIIQDKAQNLAALGSSAMETGVVAALSAAGHLAFELTGGNGSEIGHWQQLLTMQSNLNIANAQAITIDGSLYGLEHEGRLNAGISLAVHDDVAHFAELMDAFLSGNAIPLPSAIGTAFSNGQVWLTDNLADLTNASGKLTLSALQQTQGISSVAGIVVSDSVADYQVQFTADADALNTLKGNGGLNTGISYQIKDNLANIQAGLPSSGTTFLKTFLQAHYNNEQIHIVDSVAHLAAAYGAGTLTTLGEAVKTLTGSDLEVSAKDNVADLTAFFEQPGNNAFYSQLQGITVVDTAQNIEHALQNTHGLSAVALADTVVINDSYANVLLASQNDPGLLAHVSKLNLTSGDNSGASTPLQIKLSNAGNSYGFGTPAMPELLLPFMSGTLTASETSDGHGGTLVSISDASNQTITLDLLGLADATMNSGTGAFTNGDWYHIGGPGNYVGGVPAINSVEYDEATGRLYLSGNYLSVTAGDYNVAGFTLTGDGGHSYTLTGGSAIYGNLTGSRTTIQLSAADQLAVNGLLNNSGITAFDATAYNLSALAGWENGASAISTQEVTVNNASAPTLSAVLYDTASGVFTFHGSHLSNYGNAVGILINHITLSDTSTYYTLGSTDDKLGNVSANGFTITLSAADKALINGFNPLAISLDSGWDGDSSNPISDLPILKMEGGIVSNTAQQILNELPTLQSFAQQINKITLTDAGTPTIALSESDYLANIDALSAIAGSYNLQVAKDASELAPLKIPAFTMRAPVGSSGDVTLTVNVSINGAAAITVGTFTTNGCTPVEFMPRQAQPKPGDTWNLSVKASDANGISLGAGQIEGTPGLFGGAHSILVNTGYAASVKVKFLGISGTGVVSGLPTAYSATDKTYYILEGSPTGNPAVTLEALNAADTPNSVLHKYIQAGQVAIGLLDGTIQPEGMDAASPAVVLSGGDTLPVIDNNFDPQQGTLLANIPGLTSNKTVQLWYTDAAGNHPYLFTTQDLSAKQPYAGFFVPAALPSGEYRLKFTDTSGNGQPGAAIPGLQVAVSSPEGGAPSQWTANTSSITLMVGTVAEIVANAQSNVWYIVKDSIGNIQSAGNNLHNLIQGQQLIGAYPTDGFSPAFNALPDPVQIPIAGGAYDYVKVIYNDINYGTTQQAYSVLALQPKDGLGTALAAGSYSVQLFDAGKALGNAQSLTIDGSGAPLAIHLPSDGTLWQGGHSLTASMTLNGTTTPVKIGTVPAGGGLPPSYEAELKVWVGTVKQLPGSYAAIDPHTLYIVQDKAQNLAALSSGTLESGVAMALSAAGHLAYELNGSANQLSYLQQSLIERSNLAIKNVAPLTIADSVYGLEHEPDAQSAVSLVVHDGIEHYTQWYALYRSGWLNHLPNGIANALSHGQIGLVDNISTLASANLSTLQQIEHDLGIPSLVGITVADSIANFQSKFQTNLTALSTLATDLHTPYTLQVKDNIANLKAALPSSGTSPLEVLLKSIDHSQVTVVDSVANLKTAFGNNDLTNLASLSKAQFGNGINVVAKDTVANLENFLGDPRNSGLFSQLHNITVEDSAQAIENAFMNSGGYGHSISTIMAANNVVISDSYANVLNASQNDQQLLTEISKLNLTNGGSGTLKLNFNSSNTGMNNPLGIANLPELSLPFMSGALTATESLDGSNGTIITIHDNASHTVTIELLGVLDNTIVSGSGAFTQGGWYHV